ncbi:MAG: LLM class flavin-dependent oxidoreductase [Rhodospirillales bacterium]|nr:LLM class flavin-dependent oxidoreductase [Rhodospirillales bacterium]
MKFSYTHHMPYTFIDDPDQDWPVANKQFDPQKGVALYREYIDNKVFAEEVGFDWIGCNEHHMSPYGLMPNPNLIAAAVIERTKTAGILQSGNIVPLTNPIRIAEEYAMLDVQSGGRLIAGLMRGIPHEYVAYNIPPDDSFSRMREACELIVKCWTEPEPFGWEGEHYRFRAVSIWPRPVQQPHPRLLMSASSVESAKLAAEFKAIAGFLRLISMEETRKSIDAYRDAARGFGWEPVDDDIIIGMNCCIDDNMDAAIDTLSDSQAFFFDVLGGGIRTAQRLVLQKTRYYQEEVDPTSRLVGTAKALRRVSIEERIDEGLVLCGTPDVVIDQIKNLKKHLGHGRMNMTIKIGNTPQEKVLKTMHYLRDVVFPAVRDV